MRKPTLVSPKLFYRAEEVARLYGVHPNTVYAMCERGEIPGKKVGGRWKFLAVDVDEHLARRGAPQPPPRPNLDEATVEHIARRTAEMVIEQMATAWLKAGSKARGAA